MKIFKFTISKAPQLIGIYFYAEHLVQAEEAMDELKMNYPKKYDLFDEFESIDDM